MGSADFLLGELERLFELDAMMALSEDLLGLPPGDVGGTGGKGAFARALVEHCQADSALEALGDAILLSTPAADGRLREEMGKEPDSDLTAGSDHAGFRVLKRLGKGPLASVYLAERKVPDNGHAERAAIKVFDSAAARDRGAVRRFLTAVRALRNVHSTGLARIYDAGLMEDGRPWVATEYISGQSLAGRLGRTGAVHFNEVRPVARAMLRALDAIHTAGMLHGNLKMENLFLVRPTLAEGESRAQPYGVLVDAGQARLIDTQPAAGTDQLLHLVGVPQTVAPERLRGAAMSAATEVYAMGCLVYQALAGRPPFIGETPIDVLAAQLNAEPEPPSAHAPRNWVPPELDGVLMRALAKDPAERFTTAAEFADALEFVGNSLFPPAESETLDVATLMRAIAAVQETPEDEALAIALETVVEPTREWQQAVDAFMEAADIAEDLQARKALLFRSARILDQEMRDAANAEQVYRRVLELDPTDPQAHNAIEEIRRNNGDHEGLAELLLDRLDAEEDPGARAAVLREVAAIYEDELDAGDNAQVAWTQVLLEDPEDERAARAVERLTKTPEQWTETLGLLHEGLQGSDRPRVQLHLYVLLGIWYHEHLGRADVSVPYLSHALQLDPAHEPALEALTELYRGAQSWPELAQMLVHRADAAASPARARDLRTEAAMVYIERLGDMASGQGMLVDVVADDPAHPTATAALEGMLAQNEDWEGLSMLLDSKTEELRGEARCAALVQLGELYEDHLGDLEEAVRRYGTALTVDERNLPALKGLERIHAREEDYDALRGNLESQLEIAATPSQRMGLLERLGSILEEQVSDNGAAAVYFERVIEINPGHDGANTALARLYRQLQRFDDLAQTLDRHAKSVEDGERKAQLLMQAARVLMADVGSPERAAFICERVLGLAPEHTEALELTARIRALGGDKIAAVDAIEVMADTETDPVKKAELWVRAGKHLEDADDLDGAIDRYRMGLDSDPDCAAASDALRRVYGRRGDAQGEAELLLREVEQAEEPLKKAAKLVELGNLRKDRLGDSKLAQDAFEKAHDLDESNLEASLGLGLIGLTQKRWKDAAELLQTLIDHTTELGAERSLEVCIGLGDAQRALDNVEEAQAAYLQAKGIAPSDPTVLDRLAIMAVTAGDHAEAAKLLQTLLDRSKSEVSPGERAELLLSLGKAQQAAGDHKTAVVSLGEANELSPESPEVLDALRSVQADMGDYKALARTLRRRLDLAANDDERFELAVAQGDVYSEHLDDRVRASQAYVSALELRADDRNLLTKLMSVYSEDRDWSKLVEVLERMATVVDDGSIKGKYLNTAASLVQREMKDYERASTLYREALEADPTREKAFKGLAECLSRMSDWSGLASAYRGHIERVRETTPAEKLAPLWDNLAQLLHYRLERLDDAVFAYGQAQIHDPDNRQRLERMVEIYGKQPSRFADEAVQTHSALLRHNPYRMESYQALRRLYTQVQRPDEAWCVCQALRALNVAEPDEEAFFKRYRTNTPATAQECITEDLWTHYLVHPDQDPLLTAIFSMLTPAAIASMSQGLDAFGTEAKYQIDPARVEQVMPQMLNYASGVALVPLPAMYFRPNDGGGLSFMYTNPPTVGLGQGALAEAPDQALAFFAGRQLSYYRPGHYMRQLVPTGSGLRGWLLASIRLSNPRFPVQDNLVEQVDRNRDAIAQTLTAPQQQALSSLVQQLLRSAPELDMKRWAAAVDLTADRLGFVLANSLDASIAVVRASPAENSSATERDRLKELYLYCVCPEYVALRRALGIQIA